jgi:glycosyltransferase involved in cell wall biosynthesis
MLTSLEKSYQSINMPRFSQSGKKIALVANTAWYLYNFKLGLMKALQQRHYEVVAIAPWDEYAVKLTQEGISYCHIGMNNQGTNPFEDLKLIYSFYRLLRSERPHMILSYTIKPNVYGSMAANFLNIPVINTINGLGTIFHQNNWLTRVGEILLYIALRKSKKVFFQNQDDLNLFFEKGIIRPELMGILPGSGVDTEKFAPRQVDRNGDGLVFLLFARLLWDKGVGEYVNAARIIKTKYPHVDCQILGFLEVSNPRAIDRKQMERWVAEGSVSYLGHTDDVIEVIIRADCIVLPSYYREGVPRSLLEAASLAKPIITTNSVGCKEVVDDCINGYLCKIKDTKDLTIKMEMMINLAEKERARMGLNGREKAIKEFDEKIIIRKYLEVIDRVL